MKKQVKINPIGVIHSQYKTPEECPRQTCQSEQISEIEVFAEYTGGLKDIEGFSHIIILYWLHKSRGYSLLVVTPWDAEPHGLFTTRSPRRPNPMGLSVVQLIERRGNILKVKGIDAIDGTPLIDIKPYLPEFGEERAVKTGWFEGKIKG